jgi:DNA polymerase V
MLALCDCNNFFVSCERLYRPELRDRPVVVLSSNDGCIISRSNEVKAMGIPMGQPYFQVEGLLRQKGVAVCSGNLVLYKEVSEKVMRALGRFADAMEEYSIDEAFLNFPALAVNDPSRYASRMREMVDRIIGIPISVGIAPTKTLSKLASDRAKKTAHGVMEITERNLYGMLETAKIGDIWGIGHKTSEKLNMYGIFSAGDFVTKDPVWVKKHLTVRGLMTQLELKGQRCIPLAAGASPPKSIQVSRTWGTVLESFEDVMPAMTENVLSAGKQLRQNSLAAGTMSVYVRYGYRHHGQCGYFTRDIRFGNPISSDTELIGAAERLLGEMYQPGYRYTQGGVILCDFSDAKYRQRELFGDEIYERRLKLESFSRAVDAINEHFGERTVYPACLAIKEKKWRPNRKHLSEKWGGLQMSGDCRISGRAARD